MWASDTTNVNNKYIIKNATELSENVLGRINEVIALSLCFLSYILKI